MNLCILICPQCQSENPEPNKFCQECGMSLTHKDCPSCGTRTPLSRLNCANCGTETGTVWLGLLSGDSSEFKSDQRYQVLDRTETEFRVFDTQPLLKATELPAIAEPYMALHHEFPSVLPQVHDVWQQGDRELLLIEDRSDLPLLADYLKTAKSISMLQILHWFYEMLDLWELLEPWRLQQSLLEIDNLRIDEDQILCLRRLHSDTPSSTLKNLSTIWQLLLSYLQQTQSAALHTMLSEMQAHVIGTVDEVRSQLKLLAEDLPDAVPLSETMSDPTFFPSDDLPQPSSEDLIVYPSEEEGDGEDMPTVVLPMQLSSLEDAGRTDIGRQRDHNEDYFGIDTFVTKTHLASGKLVRARGLYVLCDGMGGHASGEVASQLAVDTLRNYFKQYWQDLTANGLESKLPTTQIIREAIQLANKVIFDMNQDGDRSGSGRMGTTMVMALINDTEAAIAHVGDSRLYRYTRKRGLEQMTSDHEVGQREILRGVEPEIAYGRPDAYQLTQALGPRDEHFISPDIQFFELNEDALIILASDGLTDNNLLEAHWQTHIDPLVSSQTNLEAGVNKLIDLANQYNGHDNITAIAIRVKVRPSMEPMQ
jgi:protein phosphatase